MKKNLLIIFIGVAFFIIGIFLGTRKTGNEKEVNRVRILLGTTVEIKIRGLDEKPGNDAANLAFAEVKRIDDLFSTYNEESPIWLFNNSDNDTVTVEEEIFHLIQKCDTFTNITNGGFDIAIENIMKVWNFNADAPVIPTPEKLYKALTQSGWSNIGLISNNRIVRKNRVAINLGAVAKGYAVDKAFEKLNELGIEKFLINAGGEIRHKGNDWIVGIQNPRNEGDFVERLILKDKAVATSGDYENFFLAYGKRYHHIIDPYYGSPSTKCQSVTVIADDCTTADALSTGIFVMGAEEGIKLAEKLGDFEVMIIDVYGNKFFSKGFSKYIKR